MSAKVFTFDQLNENAQEWALEQVTEKHPGENAEVLIDQYEYNSKGDIVDYSNEGQDPEYYDEMLGD